MTIQEKLKKIILYLLALVAFCVCGVFVIAVFEALWDTKLEVVRDGINSGLIAWVVMFIVPLFKKEN